MGTTSTKPQHDERDFSSQLTSRVIGRRIPDKPVRLVHLAVPGQFDDAIEQEYEMTESMAAYTCRSILPSDEHLSSLESVTLKEQPQHLEFLSSRNRPSGSTALLAPYCTRPQGTHSTLHQQTMTEPYGRITPSSEISDKANVSCGFVRNETESFVSCDEDDDAATSRGGGASTGSELNRQPLLEQSEKSNSLQDISLSSCSNRPIPPTTGINVLQVPPFTEGGTLSKAISSQSEEVTLTARFSTKILGIKSPSPLLEYLDRDHPHPSLLPNSDEGATSLSLFPFVGNDSENSIPYDNLTKVDVLLGRGGGTNHYVGNIWFRKLMERYRKAYCTSQKGQKGLLVRNLCNYIRFNGGRFLEQKEGCDRNVLNAKCLRNTIWYECGDIRAHAKVGQTLREGTASIVRETLKRTLCDTANPDVDYPEKLQRKGEA